MLKVRKNLDYSFLFLTFAHRKQETIKGKRL